jgi:hypothetical protein
LVSAKIKPNWTKKHLLQSDPFLIW